MIGAPASYPDRATLLVVEARTGPAEVGTFTAVPGDLWLGGQCAGGVLELHVDPVATLPIPCEELGDVPFLNRIVMSRHTEVTVTVSAPHTVTWNLRVEQGQD